MASRELFTDAVRAVLHSWPVLQVSFEPGEDSDPQNLSRFSAAVQMSQLYLDPVWGVPLGRWTYCLDLVPVGFDKSSVCLLDCGGERVRGRVRPTEGGLDGGRGAAVFP